jgi:Holliday junction DNA helicase RuvA
VRLLARHIVREDAQLLYGFAEREEQQLFDLLIGVNGVGPRIAMAVLSGLQPAQFARAVRDENLAAITAVNGVGRKTAERLVIELRDKLGFLPMAAAAAPEGGTRKTRAAAPASSGKVLAQSERFDDAVAALVTLGHPQPLAIETVRRISDDAGELTAEQLLRRALTALSRPTLVNR